MAEILEDLHLSLYTYEISFFNSKEYRTLKTIQRLSSQNY